MSKDSLKLFLPRHGGPREHSFEDNRPEPIPMLLLDGADDATGKFGLVFRKGANAPI